MPPEEKVNEERPFRTEKEKEAAEAARMFERARHFQPAPLFVFHVYVNGRPV
jgi:hypothetical protein